MTEEEVRELVRAEGKQKDFARRAGVSDAHVSLFLSGKRRPGPRVLKALGLEMQKTIVCSFSSCANEEASA